MKGLFLVIALAILTFSFGQSRSLQLYFTPVVNQFGDLNKQYISLSNSNVSVNYFRANSKEFGLRYLSRFKSKVAWGIGVGWRLDSYFGSVIVSFPGDPSHFDWLYNDHSVLVAEDMSISLQSSNLSFTFSYQLTDIIDVGLNVNMYALILSKYNLDEQYQSSGAENPFYVLPDTSYQDFVYSYRLNIDTRNKRSYGLVPELFVSAKVFKGLKINMGVKTKFWKNENDMLKLEVNGNLNPHQTGKKGSELLHKSGINNSDLGFFFGFTYDIPLSKKNQ